MSDIDPMMMDSSEQLDQMQASETLIDRGVADVLDEGYVTAENWSVAEGYGNTPAEMRQARPLDLRLLEEEPEYVPDDTPWNPEGEKREVGRRRAGRIVDAYRGYAAVDEDPESFGWDVGIDGGAASAEEAAMHIIDDNDEEESDLYD